jgi:hypothetical protein
MFEPTQIILAIGAAVFLVGLILVACIWAVRCRPDSPTYRNPLMLLALPGTIGFVLLLRHLAG